MDQLIVQLKALGEENRFRIMMMLREQSLCSCELLEVLDIAGGTLTVHLKVLRESGLIRQNKKGRWVHSSIADDEVRELLEILSARVSSKKMLEGDMAVIRNRIQGTCVPR